MSIHPVALFCTAILGLLLFGLGLVVSVSRFLHTTGSGCLPDPTDRLHKVVRAHGNTAEYAPFLAVLFLYVGAHAPSRAILSLIVAADRVPLPAGGRIDCLADDGQTQSGALHRRVRYVSVRRGAVRIVVLLSERAAARTRRR
ncbi:hypothetical protein BvRS1_24760 [Burkholderia vietnamiensis]|nr:hypothetical protein BvRS1_24760 [Burkholderia vietnamiensis]